MNHRVYCMITLSNSMTTLLEHNEAFIYFAPKIDPRNHFWFNLGWPDCKGQKSSKFDFQSQSRNEKKKWLHVSNFQAIIWFLLAVHHHSTVLHKWYHAIEWLAIKKKLNKIRTCGPHRPAFSNLSCSVNLSLVRLLLFALFWLEPKGIRNRGCQRGQS